MNRKCCECGEELPEEQMIQDGTMFISGDWYCEKCHESNEEYEREQGLR